MLTFLVIEDTPAFRGPIHQFLKSFGQCDLAHDEREGLGAFRMALDRGRPYDLVCLDDGGDGRVLDSIREMERARGIVGSDAAKVILCGAETHSQDRTRASEKGRKDSVADPLDKEAILRQMELFFGNLPPRVESAEEETPVRGPEEFQDRSATNRILIVDDDRVCCELLADILGPYGQCDFAYDGAEAMEAVRLALEDGTSYDLICLDIMMPGKSGHDALEGIRKLEAKHGIGGSDTAKVIMTTALRDSKHCIQSFREGCESYVTKPIAEDELLARIAELGLIPTTEMVSQEA